MWSHNSMLYGKHVLRRSILRSTNPYWCYGTVPTWESSLTAKSYRTYRTGIHYTIHKRAVPYRYCFDFQSFEPICIIAIDFRSICLSFKVIFLSLFSLTISFSCISFAISIITLYVLDASTLCESKMGGLMLPACCFVNLYEMSLINIRALTAKIYCMLYLSVCCYVYVYSPVYM
jgi:hypothetical protein